MAEHRHKLPGLFRRLRLGVCIGTITRCPCGQAFRWTGHVYDPPTWEAFNEPSGITMSDLEREWGEQNATLLPRNLVVGTMCHCDDPDECEDHWEFFTNPVNYNPITGHMTSGVLPSVQEMKAIAALVRGAIRADSIGWTFDA